MWGEFSDREDVENYANLDLNAALDSFLRRGDLSDSQVQDRMARWVGYVIEARRLLRREGETA